MKITFYITQTNCDYCGRFVDKARQHRSTTNERLVICADCDKDFAVIKKKETPVKKSSLPVTQTITDSPQIENKEPETVVYNKNINFENKCLIKEFETYLLKSRLLKTEKNQNNSPEPPDIIA